MPDAAAAAAKPGRLSAADPNSYANVGTAGSCCLFFGSFFL